MRKNEDEGCLYGTTNTLEEHSKPVVTTIGRYKKPVLLHLTAKESESGTGPFAEGTVGGFPVGSLS